MPTTTQTITSESHILASTSQTIVSGSHVLATTEQTISSDTSIRVPLFLHFETDLVKTLEDEKLVQTDSANPIPSAPISLVAIDAGLGDVVNLNWTSTAKYFNVYKKVGIVYTKLNPVVLGQVTSYSAGGLTPNVAVTFVVRAVNGIGQESGNSNEATATPTLNENLPRFHSPTYQISINSVPKPLAILGEVKLGYGSNFSTAGFSYPVDPRTGGLPDLDDNISISINGKTVFVGTITGRNDSISESGLLANYTCHSTILNLTETTIFGTDVDLVNSVFNVFEVTPDNEAIINNKKNAGEILSMLGVSGGPGDYPGQVDITDLTPLAAAELVLGKVGNYKVYHDMISNQTSVYRFGSNGFGTREFIVGKNVINYDIQKANIDIVKSVRVIGAPKQIRKKHLVHTTVGTDPDGKFSAQFTVSGKNIRDIQVYGYSREQAVVSFDDTIQVTLRDMFEASQFGSFILSTAFGKTQNVSEEDLKLRPVIASIGHYSTERSSIGAKFFYKGKDSVTASLSEVPKLWRIFTKYGNVDRKKVGLEGDGTINVSVLLGYDFTVGAIEVEYTVDDVRPSVVAGSGTPSKTITDEQYEIIADGVNGFNNEADTLSRMTARAQGELAKLTKEKISGSITVVGDETVDLRSSIRVDGFLLEVANVTHSFSNGFTTLVELTNEGFFRNVIIPPSLNIQQQPKEQEKGRRLVWEDRQTREITSAKRETATEKEQNRKKTAESGPFAVYQD